MSPSSNVNSRALLLNVHKIAREKAFTKPIIRKAFENTGIFPFQPEIIRANAIRFNSFSEAELSIYVIVSFTDQDRNDFKIQDLNHDDDGSSFIDYEKYFQVLVKFLQNKSQEVLLSLLTDGNKSRLNTDNPSTLMEEQTMNSLIHQDTLNQSPDKKK